MIYRLYNIKQNRYADSDQYNFLSINRNGNVVEVLPESGFLTLTTQWKVQYGFIHSNGKKYYQNDTHENEYGTSIIEFDGHCFYEKIKSKQTFYDVNYGGQRHHVERYNISSNTKLW